MSRGSFPFVVSFEGLPGAGKTTFSKMLVGELLYRGYSVSLVKPFTKERIELAMSPYAGERRRLWVNKVPLVPPRTAAQVLLGILSDDRLAEADVLVYDRHVDTVFAGLWAFYTQNGEDLPLPEFYDWFYHVAEHFLTLPDVTVYLRVDRDLVERRVGIYKRMVLDEYILEQLGLMERAYEYVSERSPRVRPVDSSGRRPVEIFEEVLHHVLSAIGGE